MTNRMNQVFGTDDAKTDEVDQLFEDDDPAWIDKLKYEIIISSMLKVKNILTEKYKYSEADATSIGNKINEFVGAEMMQIYTYKNPLGKYCTLNPDSKQFLTTHTTQLDFLGWLWTVTTIPFYHSLGDTIGYNNGNWEFNYGEANVGPEYVNELIYDFIDLGGVSDLSIKNWMSSDDTILYLDTLAVLYENNATMAEFGQSLKNAYMKSKDKIKNRHPGQITNDSLEIQENIEWDKLPYNSRSIGNGSAMRSGCIGIFFVGNHNRKKLVAHAIESSRITHNSAIAILGSVTTALFTAYAIEKIDINLWPHKLLKLLRSDLIGDYIKSAYPLEYTFFSRDKIIFIGKWEEYVSFRFSGINIRTDLRFMKNPVQRYKVLTEKFSKGCGIPGGCGDDVCILAFDALLQSRGVLEKLIVYSILHPGDSDTVGAIAFSWFGAFYHSTKYEFQVDHLFDELEFGLKIAGFGESKENLSTLIRIYYRDIYLNIARKYIKNYATKPAR